MDNNELSFTAEQIQQARACASPEELIALVQESGMEISEEDAKLLYEKMNPACGEMTDEELDSVTGGGCITDWLFGKKSEKSNTVKIILNNPGTITTANTLGTATGNTGSSHLTNTVYKTVSGGSSPSNGTGGGVVAC